MGAVLFIGAFAVYLHTLAPSVAYLFDDSLEFQLLASRMAIAHPTGYPLYSILIKLATFLPFGDVAYRVNLVSAVSAAGAVLLLYLAARQVTNLFFTANTLIGEIFARVPAVIAALSLAFGETFWSQAILAEVYALQAFFTALLLWLVLRWGAIYPVNKNLYASLIPIALAAGLALTHHRMTVLLLPALAVYLLCYDRTVLTKPRVLLTIALAFIIPLLLYLYLPLRGTVTSSLDGAYQNTPDGFVNWVLGTAYTVFLSQNPLNESRDATYYFNLFVNNFGAFGLLVALGGLAALFMRAWREWVLLALALAANLYFALTYRVVDIDVFFIPAFVIIALLLAAGLAGLVWFAYYALSLRWATVAAGVGALLLFFLPAALAQEHYARVDLSNKTDVIAYGQAVMRQPLPQNATIIGILGEMTLLRYLQETQNLRPDVETIAADTEQNRLSAIADAETRDRTVYLTRPLAGIEKSDSLTSAGDLIEVQPKANRSTPPTPMQKLDADFGDVKLLGYDAQLDGAQPRVTLYWQPQKRIEDARLVSLKLLRADGALGGQLDRQPVLDAYPTTAWRNGEYIADTYRVPIFVGAAPGDYAVQMTLYDPASGKVFGQQELGRIVIPVKTDPVPRELLGVQETPVRDVGGIELSGYDLDVSEPYIGGTDIPITLLWRAAQDGETREYDITVTSELGKEVQTTSGSVGGGGVKAGQYIRQALNVNLPVTTAPGTYFVRITVRGGLLLPWEANTFTLAILSVKAP